MPRASLEERRQGKGHARQDRADRLLAALLLFCLPLAAGLLAFLVFCCGELEL